MAMISATVMAKEQGNKYSNKDYKRLGDRIRSNPKEVSDNG